MENDGISNIFKLLKVAKTTAHNVLQKFKQTARTANLLKPGRLGATSDTDDHAIRWMVKKTPKLNAPEPSIEGCRNNQQ